jgi:nitrite reductase/ring-hydroxylating ferredoxin subunit
LRNAERAELQHTSFVQYQEKADASEKKNLRLEDKIVFLIVCPLDKYLSPTLVGYKKAATCPVHQHLFCPVHVCIFASNTGQLVLSCPVSHFLTDQTHP